MTNDTNTERETDGQGRPIYGNPDACGVIDAQFGSECGDETVVTGREVIDSLEVVYSYGYCEDHQHFGEEPI